VSSKKFFEFFVNRVDIFRVGAFRYCAFQQFYLFFEVREFCLFFTRLFLVVDEVQFPWHCSFLTALIQKVHLSLPDWVQLPVEVTFFTVFVHLPTQTSECLLGKAFIFQKLALFLHQVFFFLRRASFFLGFSQVFGLDFNCQVQVVYPLEGFRVFDVSANFAVHFFVFL
jgi:hypothetical protein